jgi:hypothetical protein
VTARTILRAAWIVAALACPAAAQGDDGLTAALETCATPGLALSDLASGLTNAGWLEATANVASHERFALSVAADGLITTGTLPEDAATQFARIMNRKPPAMPNPGAPLDAQQIVAAMTGGAEVWDRELAREGSDATLAFLVFPQRDSDTDVRIVCKVLSGTPLPADLLDRLLPEGATPDLDQQSSGAPQAFSRSVAVPLGEGASLRLLYTDLTTAPAFAALTAEVGASASLTTLLSVEMSHVPLR